MTVDGDRATVLLTLGSNVAPRTHLCRAMAELRRLVDVEAVSRVYESEAAGAPGTPRFLNAAVRATTGLDPAELKRRLRRLESRLGRRRTPGRPNAPRTIDVDIALFGDRIVDEPAAGLRIPDPEVPERAYLAVPLAEVGGDVPYPGRDQTLGELAARFAGQAPLAVSELHLGDAG